jgi:PKD repeat protein
MKKLLFSAGVFLMAFATAVQAQKNISVIPKFQINQSVPTTVLPAPDMDQIKAEDVLRDKQGKLYRIGVASYVNIRPENSGWWTTLPNGERQWQLIVKSEGAEALSFLFERFILNGNSTLEIRNLNGEMIHKTLTKDDVQEHFRQHAALCFGSEMILILNEPKNTQTSEIHIDRVMYNYRSTGNPNAAKINESEACQVNVNCTPVGDTWQDEKRGVARILVVEGADQGWCTGSLVNNTAQDCKPYFLTALHCGVTASAANMNQWKFYFRYESTNCNNPSTAGTLDDNVITGCLRIADSGDGGGDSGSDFLLVQLGNANNTSTIVTQLKSANFNAYWNGWNANNTATSGGTGIHHPAGDIKKISTASGNTTTAGWNGNGLQSHWRLSWTANSNGHGVTEGGSSGSPHFNNSQGYIVGTLTGGSSYCDALTSPDFYGKMSYHWTSNGTANNRRLKPWLDPTNSGLLVLAGSNDPCSAPTVPVANFTANQTNVAPATNVTFTDQSTGVPTSWAWSISPATGWAYAAGSTATSQNPVVTFNTVGQYTVTLTATNAQGSDAETKTNYIIVAQATGPCTPSVTSACDEYIQNITLNTINNTTACTTGGYVSYMSTSTSLTKGTQYTMTVTPAIGANAGAYTGDEIAIWIDYNNDFTFASTERVGYVLVGTGWSNQFTFTVPTTAITGAVRMRVRISYSVVAEGGAPIDPCAVASFGETEDYTINILAGGGSGVGIEENTLNAVSIYPNPTESLLNVDLSQVSEEVETVTLIDITGKTIQTISVNAADKVNFDLSSIASGLYYVRIASATNAVMKQVVKK